MHYYIAMMRRKGKNPNTRGRPASPVDGAAEAVARVRALKKHLKISDSALARRVGVNQSSINRALSRKPPRLTPTLKHLCNYAENEFPTTSRDFARNGRDQLARAVVSVWDGSPEGLERLLALLRLLGELSSKN